MKSFFELFRGPNGKNYAVTFALVSTLFFLWGFCNGMIDILNKHKSYIKILFRTGSAVAMSLIFLVASLPIQAQETASVKPPVPTVGEHGEKISQWKDYEQLCFTVDGRKCILVVPKAPLPGNPWIWRTEFFGAFPQADIALLGKGVYVAYMDVQNMYGAPVALDHMDKFYDHVTTTYHLAPKTVLEGFSRGGLFAFNWAARNPGKVSGLYVDAPVCDFKSWPGGKGKSKGSPRDWNLCKTAYGLTEEQALAYSLNPIDNLKPLADEHIDILSVCGGADIDVPVDENTAVVQKRYEALGGKIQVIIKPGAGHHPHSLTDPKPIVDFVLAHCS